MEKVGSYWMSGGYKLWKGRKIKVFSAKRKRYLGVWEFCEAVEICEGFMIPRFKQGKKRIHGFACWWIPLSIAKEMEKAQKKGKQNA